MECDIFMIAGEPSGDARGAEFLSALFQLSPQLKIMGIGGQKMASTGMEIVFSSSELQVMGFIDVFLALPKLIKKFYQVLKKILEINPKILITIDYPGFNLRLIQALRKRGFQGKICHYICPSIWAWGKKRIHLMEKHVDLLLCIFPFEKQLFSDTKLSVEYVGHPLIEFIEMPEESLENLICFYPGSRKKEIKRNLPFFIRLIQQLQRKFPHLSYAISISHPHYQTLIESYTKSLSRLSFFNANQLKIKPLLAVAKSGTIALELALQQIPCVITYALSPIDEFVANYVFKVKLPFYVLPNLILNKMLFPELIGSRLTDEALFTKVENLLIDKEYRQRCLEDCQKLKKILTKKNGVVSGAELILSRLSS